MAGAYYGPAGLFSTDNPQSDRMQIEAESFDEADYLGVDDRDDADDDYYDQPVEYHSFECSVHGDSTFFEYEECFPSEVESLARHYQGLHDQVCNCGQPIKFR